MDVLGNANEGNSWNIIILILLFFWIFSRQNETPNGYCQDMSNQCASAIATQTTLDNSIRTQKELCDQNVLIINQNEATRVGITGTLNAFRDEYQRDRWLESKFREQGLVTQNALLQQQLISQGQFNDVSRQIAAVDCNCLKKPPFWPVGCTPCPAPFVNGCPGNSGN